MSHILAAIKLLLRYFIAPFTGLFRLLSASKKFRRVSLGVTVLVFCGVIWADLQVDHRHLPWRPLNVDDRAGVATGFKMRLMNMGPDSWCHDLLSESTLLQTQALDPLDGKGDCGWNEAYHVDKSDQITLSGNSTYAMQCNLALGAHIWIRSIDAHAQAILGSELVRVHHVGTYSCSSLMWSYRMDTAECYTRKSLRVDERLFAG